MEEELIKEVKMRLRSLVVSSPTQMDSRLLMRDYSKLLGTHIPLTRMGYRDFVTFLRERCSDSFLLSGSPSNPILTVIVPESSKHIDKFVQRSKVPSTAKVKTKRRSIQEVKANPPKQDLVYNSFVQHNRPVIEDPKEAEVKALDIVTKSTSQNKENIDCHKNTIVTSNDVKNFLKKRLPHYNSLHNFDEAISEKDGTLSLFQDDDSGRHTSSSSCSTKARQFEELKSEIMELITAAPAGVWCTDLIRLYRERYNRELNFTRFGYTSIVSLVYVLEARVQITRPVDTGDWLLTERSRAAPAPAALRVPRASRAAPAAHAAHDAHDARADPDDALPGIQFDPDVFPADCVRFMESIAALSLADCRPGAMLEVMVGEVYSPSHFWLIRLGECYNLAMEEIMDEMTRYYSGEGRGRALARGAVRLGHYCASLYEGDWHRSVIVKIVDSDTVKVRHVDYGTVETVGVRGLRALRRAWAALPAQAVRARLAGVRPCAAARRWPHAAAAHFLRRVHDARLYANVVAVDTENAVLETLLIDTRGAEDECLSAELIRAGHADARADSALRTAECYLYPRFEALEGGDTPNMAEIHAYLRDGIALDYVDAYRRHVPAPPAPPAPEHPLHELHVASPPASPGPDHTLYVASPPAPPGPEHLLRELYVASPPASPGPDHTLYVASPPAPPGPEHLLRELYVASPPASPGPDHTLYVASPPAPPGPEHLLRELYVASPPASPGPDRTLYVASPPASPGPGDTLHELYVASPPSPELGELATRIPLLWPGACPAAPCSTREDPLSVPSVPPAPPLAHTLPAPVVEQTPTSPPPRDARPLAVRVEPSVNPRSAINPEAQVFTPRQTFHPRPVVPAAQVFTPRQRFHPQPVVYPLAPRGPTPYPPPPGLAPGLAPGLPPGLAPPPGALPTGRWFGPYPAPGVVTLSMAECDTYRQLSRVNPDAAHWYMAGTLGRALGAPAAMGPRAAMGPMRSPPGFGA